MAAPICPEGDRRGRFATWSQALAGSAAVAFASLCFLVLPGFSPSAIITLLVGLPLAASAWWLGAKRCAIWSSLVAGSTPLALWLLNETGMSEYFFLAHGALLLLVGVWFGCVQCRTTQKPHRLP